MSSELFAATDRRTGLTGAYFILYGQSGTIWNGTAFVTYSTSARNTGAVPATVARADGAYLADLPAGAGTDFSYALFARSGGSPAETDELVAGPAEYVSRVNLQAGAITDAAITFPAEAAGRPTTFLAAVRRVWEWTTNRRVRNRTSGDKVLYGADNVTVLETQTQSTTVVGPDTVDAETKGA